MPMLMSRTFDRIGVVYKAKENEYNFISDGQVGYDREELEFKELFFRPKGGELSETPEEADVVAAKIHVTVQKKENTVSDYKLGISFYNKEVSSATAGGIYNAVSASMQQVTLENTTEQQMIVVELNYAEFVNAIEYGFKLTGTAEYAKIVSCTLGAEVYSVLTPPVVTFRPDLMSNGYVEDGTYIHMPDMPFVVRYDYEQEKNAEMIAMGVEMIHPKNAGEAGYWKTESGSETEYAFDKQEWGWAYIPQEGKIGLRAKTNAGSQITYSDVVYLPYKIAHRIVQFTDYASGDVIKNNEEVEVGWSTVVAQGFNRCPRPSAYTVYYWWDNSEVVQTVLTTSESHTFTAEDLKGGNVLHIRVQEQYGDGSQDDVKRTKESSAEISLFVETVSEVMEYRLKYGGTAAGVGTYYNPVPAAAWVAEGQAAAQVRFGDVTFPVIWGDQSSYNLQHIYDDGIYALQVRIQNKNGVWTEWTPPKYYKIYNETADKTGVYLAVEKTERGALLQITDGVGETTYDKYQWAIFRDGVLIAQAPYRETLEYIDGNGNGKCIYQVRLMLGQGSYYKSENVEIDLTQKHDTIRLEDGEIVKLRYTTQFPRIYNYRNTEEIHMAHFAGRNYPTAIRSGKKNRSISLEYADKDRSIAEKLERSAGTEVLFKDTLGGKIKGIMNDVTGGHNRHYATVSFTITAVDWAEEIPYTWED